MGNTATIEYDPKANEQAADRICEEVAERIQRALPELVRATYDADQTSTFGLNLKVCPATEKNPLRVEVRSKRSLPDTIVEAPGRIRSGPQGPQLEMFGDLTHEYE